MNNPVNKLALRASLLDYKRGLNTEFTDAFTFTQYTANIVSAFTNRAVFVVLVTAKTTEKL